MSFKQIGNSCGAWCVTRYLSLVRYNSWESDESMFKAKAQSIYNSVKFQSGDGGHKDWVSEQYSNPCRLIDALGGKAELCVETATNTTKDVILKGFLSVLPTLKPKKKTQSRDINSLAKGYAITIMEDYPRPKKGPTLHYLLLHKDTDLRLYDPRSETLNWTKYKTFGFMDMVITEPIIGTSPSPQQFKFLGVYIQI